MARSNKYASLNFNDIYEKKIINNPKQQSPQSNSSKTIISNSRIHGNMLVLSRPSPKPISLPSPPPSPLPPPPSPSPQQQQQYPDHISLRPLGHTGSGPPPLTIVGKDKDLNLNLSPKTNKFVPPHLRPGFVGREEKPQAGGGGVNNRPGSSGGEEARPKSGGGYERMKRGFEPDPVLVVNRPGSSGPRLSSTG